MDEIENKVAKSGLITLDMADFSHTAKIVEIDIKAELWQGMALKEKDFRRFISDTNWDMFSQKHVAVYCSADALIPNWAWMLIATELAGKAERVFFGTPQSFASTLVKENIQKADLTIYIDQRIIVKGCGDVGIDFSAFGYLAERLTGVVRSLMFGEPCSTVPVYKR